MIHFIDPNFVEKDGVLYKGPPGGEDLQPADGGVRPGVKTGFDAGGERKVLFEVADDGDAVPRHEEEDVVGDVVG